MANTRLVVSINSGSSLVARDAVIHAMGVSPSAATIGLDAPGNVISVDAPIELSHLYMVILAVSMIPGVSGVATPDLGSTQVVHSDVVTDIRTFAENLNVDMNHYLIDLRDWVISNDVGVQFSGGADGLNGFASANHYNGAPNANVAVPFMVTDGDGTKDIMNNVTSVRISIANSTAAGATLDGGAGPVTKTLVRGAAQVLVKATGAGVVTLLMDNLTHPNVALRASDTAIVTIA